MSLTSYFYDPFSEPFFAASDFNRLFDAAWDARTPSSGREVQRREDPGPLAGVLRPRMDLCESKDKGEMMATIELPGLKKEDVSLDVQNNRLTVSAQSSVSSTVNQEGYAVHERRFGKFTRTLPLPSGIKAEDIKANMEHGVLTIRYPKSHPDQAPKKITIS